MKCAYSDTREDLIDRYLTGELSARDMEQFEEHAFQCDTCLQEFSYRREVFQHTKEHGREMFADLIAGEAAGVGSRKGGILASLKNLVQGGQTKWAYALAVGLMLVTLTMLTFFQQDSSLDEQLAVNILPSLHDDNTRPDLDKEPSSQQKSSESAASDPAAKGPSSGVTPHGQSDTHSTETPERSLPADKTGTVENIHGGADIEPVPDGSFAAAVESAPEVLQQDMIGASAGTDDSDGFAVVSPAELSDAYANRTPNALQDTLFNANGYGDAQQLAQDLEDYQQVRKDSETVRTRDLDQTAKDAPAQRAATERQLASFKNSMFELDSASDRFRYPVEADFILTAAPRNNDTVFTQTEFRWLAMPVAPLALVLRDSARVEKRRIVPDSNVVFIENIRTILEPGVHSWELVFPDRILPMGRFYVVDTIPLQQYQRFIQRRAVDPKRRN